MKRKSSRQPSLYEAARNIVFQPALTPIEAAALPAKEAKGFGTLGHARAMWQLDAPLQSGERTTRLGGWHLQRQNI